MRILNKNSKKIFLSFNIFLLLFISTFKNPNSKDTITEVLIFIASLPLLVSGCTNLIDYIKNKFYLNNKIFNFWLFFSLLLLISEIQNGNIYDSLFLILIPLNFLYKPIDERMFFSTMFWGSLFLSIAASLAVILGNRFSSNTIGLIVAFNIIMTSVIVLFFNLDPRKIFFLGLHLLMSVYTAIKINSRTSILIILISFLMISTHFLYKNIELIKGFKHKNRMMYLTILFITISALFYISFKGFSFIFTPKWRQDDISTGRFSIWKTVINNTTLFGHSYDWFDNEVLFGVSKGPHNGMIGILAYGGIIPLIAYCVFMLNFYKVSLNDYFRNPTTSNFLPIFTFTIANTKGITESLIIRSPYQIYNFLILFSLCAILIRNNKLEKKDMNRSIIDNENFKSLFLFFFMILTVFYESFNFEIKNIINLFNKYL